MGGTSLVAGNSTPESSGAAGGAVDGEAGVSVGASDEVGIEAVEATFVLDNTESELHEARTTAAPTIKNARAVRSNRGAETTSLDRGRARADMSRS